MSYSNGFLKVEFGIVMEGSKISNYKTHSKARNLIYLGRGFDIYDLQGIFRKFKDYECKSWKTVTN